MFLYYRKYGFDWVFFLLMVFVGCGVVPLKVIPVRGADDFGIQSVNGVMNTFNIINKMLASIWFFLLIYFCILLLVLLELDIDFVYLQL